MIACNERGCNIIIKELEETLKWICSNFHNVLNFWPQNNVELSRNISGAKESQFGAVVSRLGLEDRQSLRVEQI